MEAVEDDECLCEPSFFWTDEDGTGFTSGQLSINIVADDPSGP